MSKVSCLENGLRNAEDPALATCCGNLKRGAKGFGSSARYQHAQPWQSRLMSLENLGRLKLLCCSHDCCPVLQYTQYTLLACVYTTLVLAIAVTAKRGQETSPNINPKSMWKKWPSGVICKLSRWRSPIPRTWASLAIEHKHLEQTNAAVFVQSTGRYWHRLADGLHGIVPHFSPPPSKCWLSSSAIAPLQGLEPQAAEVGYGQVTAVRLRARLTNRAAPSYQDGPAKPSSHAPWARFPAQRCCQSYLWQSLTLSAGPSLKPPGLVLAGKHLCPLWLIYMFFLHLMVWDSLQALN